MATISSIGALTALNATSTAIWIKGPFNFDVSGTFVGTATLERSFDAGTTWATVSRDTAGNACSYTTAVSISGQEPEDGVMYRAKATAFTSGTIATRISQ